MPNMPIEISAVALRHGAALATFFESVRADESSRFFHPHAMTREVASKLAMYDGDDLYYVMTIDSNIVGYGMLRGWDKGHDIPSVGMLIRPDFRGRGLGRLFMNFLQVSAALRGAKQLFLHVDQRNDVALKLYRSLGYKLAREENHEEFVGRLSLVCKS